MASTETAIHWMELRRGVVKYSMANRYGPDSYDSSSAVFYALQAGELLEVSNSVGNTNDLFNALNEDAGWTVQTEPRRGDVVLFGRKGYASGYAGNAGIFIDTTRIIYNSHTRGTIVVQSYADARTELENPPVSIRRTNQNDSSEPTSLTNVGELEYLGIRENHIHAEGWHYSSDRPYEFIQFINAETDEVIASVPAPIVVREDIAEKYSSVEGVENSGFDVSVEVEDGTAVYVKGVRSTNSGSATGDELVFSKILIYEQAFAVDEDLYARHHSGDMWFEILDDSNVLVRGNDFVDDFSWDTELMYVPATSLTIPACYANYITGREEVKVYVNHKVFHGLVVGHETNQDAGTIVLELRHVMAEWEYRQVSTNLAIKNQTISDIYSTLDFRYVGWNIDYQQDSATRLIDYVYSRQTKLEALTKTCSLTQDLFWRVSFDFGRRVEIGSFGEKKPYILSDKPRTDMGMPNAGYLVPIISGVTIDHDYDNVVNMITVYGEKSDSGMSSMSLREVYNDSGSQLDGFPVLILKNGINNERNYDYIEFTKLAPNNEIEYTILDLESIALESGIVIEGTKSFNDLAPFNTDGDEITDEDRAVAAQTAYDAGVWELKQNRRRLIINMSVADMPPDVNVGDQIRFIHDWTHLELQECTKRECEVINENDWFYVTSISYSFPNGKEINEIRLEKSLQLDREWVSR